MINGVEIKVSKPHVDHRGFFLEIVRNEGDFMAEGIGQLSHSLVYSGVIKAWHAHKVQAQWNYVLNGIIYVALYDNRPGSSTFGETMTFLCGDNQNKTIYKFPSGVLHGYKCINGPMNILYITSGKYDLNDEIRIKHDDPKIGFDWINTFEIK
ncbi:dTDP-4-dehydrorhamnose 3,5-epimerase family protein [Flavobacteriaceae bacterium]|nr:dTDP-4-dehydrorhamnose 3,5-epimerase family protein [Flavobacteriaceae bacterium]